MNTKLKATMKFYNIIANWEETRYTIQYKHGLSVCIQDDEGNRGKPVEFETYEEAEAVAHDLYMFERN